MTAGTPPVESAPLDRDLTCRAPAVSMHFTVAGGVQACCQNGTYEFGDIRTMSLIDIWDSVARQDMADALAVGTYPSGCDLCAVEHAVGNREATPAPGFDHFSEAPSRWPRELEFTLSNRCNLACVQCNGDNSSTIRSRREGRPPLPMPYGDAFFDQLLPFLEHVEVVAFLGGEPFLTPQAKRVWDLLLDHGLAPRVQVTTNATVWSEEIERYVEGLRMDLAISIDGATASTYEAIRVGADHGRVLEIRDRLIAANRRYGGDLQLNYCLMRSNWHEVGAFLLDADHLDVDVNIVPVFAPSAHSVFSLSGDQIDRVLDGLELENATRRHQLGRNGPVWDATVTMLRDHRDRLGSDTSRESQAVEITSRWRSDAERAVGRVATELLGWAGRDCIVVQVDDAVITHVDGPPWSSPLGPGEWVGLPLDRLTDAVAMRLGPISPPEHIEHTDNGLVVQTDLVAAAPAGPVRLRSAYIARLGRLLITTPDPLG